MRVRPLFRVDGIACPWQESVSSYPVRWLIRFPGRSNAHPTRHTRTHMFIDLAHRPENTNNPHHDSTSVGTWGNGLGLKWTTPRVKLANQTRGLRTQAASLCIMENANDGYAMSLLTLQLRKAGLAKLFSLYCDADTLISLFDKKGR